MTRKGMLVWGGLIFFIMGWMFVLGILVGRGTAPLPPKTFALEKELNAMKTAIRIKEKADAEAIVGQKEVQATELGFYEALKKPPAKEGHKIPSASAATQKRPEPAPLPRKKEIPVAATAVPAPRAPQPDDPAAKSDQRPAPAVKPEKADQAPAAASAPPQGGRLSIQVAAFKDLQSAEKVAAALRAKGYPGFTLRTEIPGKGVWFRVRVGAFENRTAAEGMLKRLQGDQFKGLVVGTP